MGEYSILSSYPIFFLIFIFFYILFEMNRFCGIVALFLLFCFATNLVNAEGGNEDKLKSIAGEIDDQIEKIFKTGKSNGIDDVDDDNAGKSVWEKVKSFAQERAK